MARYTILFALGVFGCSTQRGRRLELPDSSFVDADDGGGDGGFEPPNDATDATTVIDDVIIWAHSRDHLFAFDPRTSTVTNRGRFLTNAGLSAPPITDLAVNKEGQIYACSHSSLFLVNPETAQAAWISDLTIGSFVGLTFVPAGEIDADKETLVGASGGTYYRVEIETGVVTELGTFSNSLRASGDLVSVEHAGTFATVRNLGGNDLLVELKPESGEAIPIGAGTGFGSLFGLGYWRSRMFAFSNTGELIVIDMETGRGELVTHMTGATEFWGAGVTTIAPTGPF